MRKPSSSTGGQGGCYGMGDEQATFDAALSEWECTEEEMTLKPSAYDAPGGLLLFEERAVAYPVLFGLCRRTP